jgi:glycosyltransferase involved in cell wall biosynthesis
MNITVVTPTWQRHDILINRCLPSVAAQTVPVEHIVVSDGPDPVLRELLASTDVVYVEVDEHHTEGVNVGGWARNRGLEFASGDLIAYLDDDNVFRPNHVELLAKALTEHSDRDFAYSQMFRHGLGDVIGTEPPAYGCIDSSIIMHRADTHKKFGLWPAPSEYHIDWQVIEAWLLGGATWVFVPEVTVDYYFRGYV